MVDARPNIENVYAASVRVGSHNEAGGGRELVPLSLAQIFHESADLGFDTGCRQVDECLPGDGDDHLHAATVDRRG